MSYLSELLYLYDGLFHTGCFKGFVCFCKLTFLILLLMFSCFLILMCVWWCDFCSTFFYLIWYDIWIEPTFYHGSMFVFNLHYECQIFGPESRFKKKNYVVKGFHLFWEFYALVIFLEIMYYVYYYLYPLFISVPLLELNGFFQDLEFPFLNS